MGQRIVVVGAGVIGAAVAYRLQSQGAQVTVIHDGATRATDASFGWINASFFLDHGHFRLRFEGISAWQRLLGEMSLPIRQSGCLCWDMEGDALQGQVNELTKLGYPFEVIERDHFKVLEPHVANPPTHSLFFPKESVAEAGALADTLLGAAIAAGAIELSGLHVAGFLRRGDRIVGVETKTGPIEADQVLVATGTGTPSLLENLGVSVPLLERPALVLTTNTLPKMVNHVLVSELGEIKQCDNGALMLPVAVGHQGDCAEQVDTTPDKAGDAALKRLQTMFPEFELSVAGVQLGFRPVPKDGLPIAGNVQDGLYLAVMHSGITLAAIMAELISEEMLRGVSNHTGGWLGPYRPERFLGHQ